MQRGAAHAVAVLRSAIQRRNVSTTAAVVPTAVWEGDVSSAFGTVGALGFERVEVMAYSSLFHGLSFGTLDRSDALALLSIVASQAAADVRARTRPVRLALALGCVGTGALGNEPLYAGPSELREDVAVVRAAGIDDLALLDLGGVLARPPLESWLDAFVQTEASTSTAPTSLRARVLAAGMDIVMSAEAARSGSAR